MACGRPSLVANEGFRETLGDLADTLLFRRDDPSDLSRRLQRVLELDPSERKAIGTYLRRRVQELHGLDHLADRLLGVCREAQEARAARR